MLEKIIATKTATANVVFAALAVSTVVAAVAVGVAVFSGGGLPAVLTVTKTCVDPNETVNKDVPLAIVSKNPLYFNPDIKSKAYQKPYGSYYQDVCLIDVAGTMIKTLADGTTTTIKVWRSTPVNDCSVADEDGVTKRFCRLQEGFCTGANVSNYFFKCPNGCNNGACVNLLAITIAEARNISDRSVTVYWQASTGSQGEYRYATDQADLVNQAWTDSGVVNGPDSGHLFGSIVSFGTLNANTTYYVELRKWVGVGENGKIYGPTKIISFTTIGS